jgi:hypothetical protein
VSPLGLWKAENGRINRWTLLANGANGAYGEYAMTSHRTSTNHCLVRPNTLVYRYHPLGGGLYRMDSFLWRKSCTTHWSLNEETIKITVTRTRMTHSCNKQYRKVCWTYTRTRDTQPPKVRALDSEGSVNGVTSLRYVVSDDSGRSWEALTIYRDGVIARRYRTTLTSTLVGPIYRGVKVSCWRATATSPLPSTYGLSISDKMAGVFRFDAKGRVTTWGVMRRQPSG